MELPVISLIKRDAFLCDVHEEVATVRQTVIHFAKRVNDEVDWRTQCLVDGEFAHQSVVELEPVVDLVGQALVIDNDQDVEVGAVAFGRVRFVYPAAPCIAAIEDDLLDLSFLLPLMLCERQRIFKLFKDDCLHAFDLALLGCRKVIKVGAHIAAHS